MPEQTPAAHTRRYSDGSFRIAVRGRRNVTPLRGSRHIFGGTFPAREVVLEQARADLERTRTQKYGYSGELVLVEYRRFRKLGEVE